MGLDPEPPRVDPDRPPSPYASLGAVELDDLLNDLGGLLGELGERAASASGVHARLGALLDAVVAVTSGLELADVLSRIIRAACSLAGARYGARRARTERRAARRVRHRGGHGCRTRRDR